MNSKGHLYISIAKSGIRIFGAIVTYITKDVMILAWTFGVAEILGVAEELADNR